MDDEKLSTNVQIETGIPHDDFEYAIVDGENGDECTIYPRTCRDDEIVTQWVTAAEHSFVTLAEMR